MATWQGAWMALFSSLSVVQPAHTSKDSGTNFCERMKTVWFLFSVFVIRQSDEIEFARNIAICWFLVHLKFYECAQVGRTPRSYCVFLFLLCCFCSWFIPFQLVHSFFYCNRCFDARSEWKIRMESVAIAHTCNRTELNINHVCSKAWYVRLVKRNMMLLKLLEIRMGEWVPRIELY